MERLHLRRRLGGHRLLGRGLALSQGDRRLRDCRRHRLLAADPRIAHAQRLPRRLLSVYRRRDRMQSATRLGERYASRYWTVRELRCQRHRRRPRRPEQRATATPVSTTKSFFTQGKPASSGLSWRSARRPSMPTTIRMMAELRRRCWSAPGTRSTRPALVNGRFGGPTSTFGVAASPRASIRRR